jgi:hypothetical protein
VPGPIYSVDISFLAFLYGNFSVAEVPRISEKEFSKGNFQLASNARYLLVL